MKKFLRKAKNFIVYSVLYHLSYLFLELLPNLYVSNRIRGGVLGLFFKKTGKNFAMASGSTFVMVRNLEVGDDVYIAHDCWINATAGLQIESGVIVSPKVVIATTQHRYRDGAVVLRESDVAPVLLGAGCWICSNVTITKGVTVGAGCVVSAGSVVTKSLPGKSMCAGQPAVKLKELAEWKA